MIKNWKIVNIILHKGINCKVTFNVKMVRENKQLLGQPLSVFTHIKSGSLFSLCILPLSSIHTFLMHIYNYIFSHIFFKFYHCPGQRVFCVLSRVSSLLNWTLFYCEHLRIDDNLLLLKISTYFDYYASE